MNSKPINNAQKLALAAGVIIVMLLALSIYLIAKPSHKNNPGSSNQKVDSFSHQTVSSPAGKAPDNYGVPQHSPLYLGFDKLIDHGMTFDQLNNLKSAFYNYSKSQNFSIQQVSVDVDNINVYKDAASGQFYMAFNVMMNSKSVYQAKVYEVSDSAIRLLLDSSGNNIYDSQVIDTQNAVQ